MDDLEESTVTILLLGDPEVGKSTFLSRLSLGRSQTTNGKLPLLRDEDQPFIFNIRMYNRPYRFEIYDTSSPTAYTLLTPDVLVLCYDISDRSSLYSLKTTWASTIHKFCLSESVPLLVLGLKRDLRKEWAKHEQEAGVLGESVMPQEGVRVAGEMRVDRYAECSAVTGELCQEVLEDISKMAAMSTTENGGKSEGPACEVM